MNNIHRQYKKRRNIYFGLIAALFGILITYGIIAPQGEHQTGSIELIMFGGLIGIAIAIYAVLRCPKCNASLVRSFSSWGKLRHCPRCGVAFNGGTWGRP